MGDYLRMLNEQHGVCVICERPDLRQRAIPFGGPRSSDGAVRGLLCGSCNQGIGYLCDDPVLLRRAADYLDRYKGSKRVLLHGSLAPTEPAKRPAAGAAPMALPALPGGHSLCGQETQV